jgi:hypothetical protein
MDITNILTKRYREAIWTLHGESYENLEWHSEEIEKPTKEELEALWPIVRHEIDCELVELQRKDAYLQVSDSLFFQYQRGEILEQQWLDAVQSIKDMYPYPSPPS